MSCTHRLITTNEQRLHDSCSSFTIIDGTTVARAYWLETGILARDFQRTRLMLPKSFGQAIQAALPVLKKGPIFLGLIGLLHC